MYKPLKFFTLFIVFTIIVSFWGPVKYMNYDKVSVAVFMTLFLIVCHIGYYFGANNPIIKTRYSLIKEVQLIKIVKTCIYITLLFQIFTFISMWANGELNLSITSMGRNYTEYYSSKREVEVSYSFRSILLFFMGFPRLISLTLGIYFYKLFSKKIKIYIWSIIALIIMTATISLGNQKSISEIVICFTIMYYIRSLDYSKIKRKIVFRNLAFLLCAVLILMSIIQSQRIDSMGLDVLDMNSHNSIRRTIDYTHWIFDLFPPFLAYGLTTILSGYIAAGYYGLSLCLSLPFVWTYGIGSSLSVTLLFEKLNIAHVLNDTYLMRMQHELGWNGLSAWNSIFPWLASDITFVGAILIFIPVAYLFAVCWKEILLYRNPISMVVFVQLATGAIFIPANNQLFHGVDSFICNIILLGFWIAKHKSYNYISNE